MIIWTPQVLSKKEIFAGHVKKWTLNGIQNSLALIILEWEAGNIVFRNPKIDRQGVANNSYLYWFKISLRIVIIFTFVQVHYLNTLQITLETITVYFYAQHQFGTALQKFMNFTYFRSFWKW